MKTVNIPIKQNMKKRALKRISAHMAIHLYLAASFCVSAWSGVKVPDMPPRTHRTVYKAQQSIKQKAFKKACTDIKTFLHKHPEDDHYLLEFTWGNALALSGRYLEAAQHYKKALDLYNEYGPAWQNLGRVYVKMRKYAMAGNCLAKACEFANKKDTECRYNAGLCYLMAGMPKKAFPYLKDIVTENKTYWKPEWLKAYLDCCIDLKQENVSNIIEVLINRYGNRPETWKILGNFYLRKNDYKNALACLTVHSYFTPPDTREAILLGDLSSLTGLPAKACEYYRMALKHKDNPTVRRKLANAYIKAHMYDKAVTTLKNLSVSKPSPKILSLIGDLYYQEAKFKKACKAYKQAVKFGRKTGRIMLMIASCAIHMKNPDLAKKALSEAAHFPGYRKKATHMLKLYISRLHKKANTRIMHQPLQGSHTKQ